MKTFILCMAVLCLVGCSKKERVNGVALTFDELETAVYNCESLFRHRGLANQVINHQVTLDPKNDDMVNRAVSAYMQLHELNLIHRDQDFREVGLVCQAVNHQYENP